MSKGELLALVEPDDLIGFGLIPEFIGRLHVVAPLMPLSVDDMVRILLEPRDALVKQYQAMFEMEGAHLEFSDEALRVIAERALERNTGARALRMVLDHLMLDPMFDLPNRPKDYLYVVTPEVVSGERNLLDQRYKKRA